MYKLKHIHTNIWYLQYYLFKTHTHNITNKTENNILYPILNF